MEGKMETLFNAVKNRIIYINVLGNTTSVKIGTPEGNFITKTMCTTDLPAYREDKLKHGYNAMETDIKKSKIQRHPLLDKLASISRQITESAYKTTVVPSAKSIEEARTLLNDMTKISELMDFNSSLYKLFALIPRKMKNPILYTAKNKEDFKEILDRENNLLTNLEANVSTCKEEDISFEDCSKEEIEEIKSHLDRSTQSKFITAYRVRVKKQDQAFEEYLKERHIKETKLLYHGSRTENWYSIIKTGLKVNPVDVAISGKMFGNGIYFAPKADKSVGYTSICGSRWANGSDAKGYLGVYEVATGKEHLTELWDMKDTELTEAKFKGRYPGKDCFHALAGRNLLNDEIIVYNNNACRVKYLIELSIRK